MNRLGGKPISSRNVEAAEAPISAMKVARIAAITPSRAYSLRNVSMTCARCAPSTFVTAAQVRAKPPRNMRLSIPAQLKRPWRAALPLGSSQPSGHETHSTSTLTFDNIKSDERN